jgi:hypothetical protein
MRISTQNGVQVAEVAIALAARLRALAEDLERVETVAAVCFTRDVERRNGQQHTSVEITLVEDIR